MVHFIHGRALLYTNNNANFYARESSTSKWVKLIAFDADGNSASNNHPDVTRRIITDWSVTPNEKKLTNYYTIPTKYVEFGFEFYLKGGTNYPYSDVFWTAEDSAKTPANNILIDTLGGGLYTPRLTIKVNDQEVFHDSNCSAHIPHYFKMDDDTHVKTWKTGTYLNKAMNFYARKSENGLWTQVKSWTDGDQDFTIPETEGYVEYGFEFYQKDGTDWPYSGVFWTASDSEREEAGLIYIEMGGTMTNGDYEIEIDSDYVDFGFEFDVTRGTDWPYSGEFWHTSSDGIVDGISIELGGGVRTANISIIVNNRVIVWDPNCDSHTRHE